VNEPNQQPVNDNTPSTSGHLATLALVALRAFANTLLLLALAGVVLAGVSYYALSDYHWFYAVIAAVVAVLESLSVGVVLAMKRAVVLAVVHGLGTLKLGRTLVNLVFDKMREVSAQSAGGAIARGLERVPLAQAEALLSSAVNAVMCDISQAGWLRRKIQGKLLAVVQKYTLARFRKQGAAHGGIDLQMVQEELQSSIDQALIQKLRGGLRLWTVLVILVLPLVVAAQTWVVLMLLRA
jgi:hypothetical protein